MTIPLKQFLNCVKVIYEQVTVVTEYPINAHDRTVNAFGVIAFRVGQDTL